ncbi:hypothetical protein [Actinobaculum sp. 313]|uniref:hypothetical protein n=1 Tax=Actinobaculum sp. 313 TaxID=2495645 RepID=UPI000D52614C|nr:hypothetical protein [Actinobaculum sp. 313]AWE42789.1 hypothetical protein DDD63_08575 [Actinobaculum sp. 313]
MRVDEVTEFLIRQGVRPSIFAINTVAVSDAIVLYQEGPNRFALFYTERGIRVDERIYDSEEEACQGLITQALEAERFARDHETKTRGRGER